MYGVNFILKYWCFIIEVDNFILRKILKRKFIFDITFGSSLLSWPKSQYGLFLEKKTVFDILMDSVRSWCIENAFKQNCYERNLKFIINQKLWKRFLFTYSLGDSVITASKRKKRNLKLSKKMYYIKVKKELCHKKSYLFLPLRYTISFTFDLFGFSIKALTT